MTSSLIIAYLFLGGAGAGMLFVLSAMSLLAPRLVLDPDGFGRVRPDGMHVRLYGLGFCVAAVICVVAALCLVFDMARPDAILSLMFNPNPSVVTIGAYALGLCILLGAVLAAFWLAASGPRTAVCRVVSALALVASLVVMTYTGLLLGIIPHAVFWQSPLVVVLFVVSSLSCGIALVMMAMTVFRLLPFFRFTVRRLFAVDAVLIVFEALALAAFVTWAYQAVPEACDALVRGPLAIVFWAGLVGVGLTAPLLMEVALRADRQLTAHPMVPALLVLAGGLCLRICIVFAA